MLDDSSLPHYIIKKWKAGRMSYSLKSSLKKTERRGMLNVLFNYVAISNQYIIVYMI